MQVPFLIQTVSFLFSCQTFVMDIFQLLNAKSLQSSLPIQVSKNNKEQAPSISIRKLNKLNLKKFFPYKNTFCFYCVLKLFLKKKRVNQFEKCENQSQAPSKKTILFSLVLDQEKISLQLRHEAATKRLIASLTILRPQHIKASKDR